MDYTNHFGLHRSPFDNSGDPEFHYPSYEHEEALERLLYIVEQGDMSFGMLTGEIGCGKSMTRKVLKQRINPMDYQVVDLENCNLPFQYLLMYINKQLGGKLPDANSELAEKFHLLEEYKRLHNLVARRSMSLVIILDEAQQLSAEDLIEFKNITNYENADNSTTTIILIGQPELRDTVQGLPPLDQRISLRFHLHNLPPREVAEYISHRLRISGHATGQIFADEAIAQISNATRGIPREVNRACKLCLDATFALGETFVSGQTANAVLSDLQRQRY